MRSQILERTMRGAVAATAVAATVSLASAPASANPSDTPTSSAGALHQFHKLSNKAEKLNEAYLNAKTDLQHKQSQLHKADADLSRAHRAERRAQGRQRQFRGQVNELADASYQGARFNQLSALLTGQSPQDFLDRASALHVIASDNYNTLHELAGATKQAQVAAHQAQSAQQRAKHAKDAANKLVHDIRNRNQKLQAQISKVKSAMQRLSAQQRQQLAAPGDTGVFIAPAGAAGKAMQFALDQRGKPYSWGAGGPSSYDCSGLTMAAYQQAGISLPHSSQAQSEMGQPVSRSELQPGDLIFFGNPAHHVGMYVGGGKMVDAPNSGEVVKVEGFFSDYSGARRLAG